MDNKMPETSPPLNPVRARWQLLGLMMIPMCVVLLATFVYYTGIGMPEGTRNKGKLIVPPLQINDIGLQNDRGESQKLEGAKDEMWTFLIVHSGSCDENCRKQFWEIRQTRIALGKYQDHIRRVWLVNDGQFIDVATREWLSTEHPDITVVYSSADRWLQLLGQSLEGIASKDKARFYLVDPRGFVMMYYSAENTYKDVIVDMKFLLKGVE
jgi:hypothetical protein